MALIVNTTIGTDRGLTNNAYIRINEYRVLKTGECIFDIHIYKSKEDAIIADSNVGTYGKANHLTCMSLEIGKTLNVNLAREIVKEVTVPKDVPVTATVQNWREHWPGVVPLPHPSPRNNLWLRRNPWFTIELLPALRILIREVLERPSFR